MPLHDGLYDELVPHSLIGPLNDMCETTGMSHYSKPAAWGKLDAQSCNRLRLTDHCLDVAVVFTHLIPLRPPPQSLSPRQEARLAVIAFLHDIGKCNWGFQAKADPAARQTAGHIIEAAALCYDANVQEILPDAWHVLIETMCGWFMEGDVEVESMLLAAFSHHGRPISENEFQQRTTQDRDIARWWRPQGNYDPMIELETLIKAARHTFPEAFETSEEPLLTTPALQHWFAGLLMLADWIGSDTRFFPYPCEGERHVLAKTGAHHALDTIGLAAPATRRPPPAFSDCFGFTPSPLQQAFAEHIDPGEDTRLVLAESDTGSGKTEAALAWFMRLYAEGHVDGLYFALPTRVAARELYDRVRKTMEKAFTKADARPGPVLLAAPGYVRIDGEALLPNAEGTLWEDDAQARRRERFWAAEHPKRFLAAPIAVGTIDQALLSVLMVKHALLRSACLDRHLLIVDEVHASSPYMREVLKTLLAAHQRRGGWALLLSATLGEVARAEFFGHRGHLPLADSEQRPYPAITTRKHDLPIDANGRIKEVSIEPLQTMEDEALMPILRNALQQGARVLVICNTVGRAIALQRAVEIDNALPPEAMFQVNGMICPHHGRYAKDDREVMDAVVSQKLGKNSADGPLLLIGTQTLEQSLDIDADLLITDLCPMDVLLQRIGRLHRHQRTQRPASFATPRVIVRMPHDGDLTTLLNARGELRGSAGLGSVYEDGRVLQRTADILRENSRLRLPDQNRWLIEAATHPEALAQLGDTWRKHGDEIIEGKLLNELRAAETSVLSEQPFGELQYKAPEERIATRLGAGAVTLPLDPPATSPFGRRLAHVGIPAHMLPHADLKDLPERLTTTPTPDGFTFELAGKRFCYTRHGLESDDAQPSG